MGLLLKNGPQKPVKDLSYADVAWLAHGDDLCKKLGLTICCKRCLMEGRSADAVIRGANDTSDHTITVSCQCRTLIYRTVAVN